MNWLVIIYYAVISGYSAFLANRGIAIFNHQLRTEYGNYVAKDITRNDLFDISLKLAIPTIIGIMLPISIATNILSFFIIFLVADMIGIYFKKTLLGMIMAITFGLVFGAANSFLFQVFMLYVPPIFSIDFITPLTGVFEPLLLIFALIPATAIGIDYGAKKSIAAAFLTILVYIVTLRFLPQTAIGAAFLVGTFIYILMSAKDANAIDFNQEQVVLFKDNVKRIKDNLLYFMIMGGLLAIGSFYLVVSTDTLTQALIANNLGIQAGFVMFFIAISIIPKVFISSTESGAFNPIGFGFAIVAGYLSIGLGNLIGPIVAVTAGALIGGWEATAMPQIAQLLDDHKRFKKMAQHMRSSSRAIQDIAIFIGSMLVANIIYPDVGYIFVFAFWFINRSTPTRYFEQVAIGPASIILMGLVVNLLRFLDLLI
jgi:hypothetical protein